MIKNERGSTLLTVVIISVVFLLLGMSILTSTVGSVKRTETRNSELSITYNTLESIDSFTTILAQKLNSFQLKDYRKISFDNKIEVNPNYSTELNKNILIKSLEDFLEGSNTTNLDMISCINIIELNGQLSTYLIDSSEKYKQIGACLGDLSIHEQYSTAYNFSNDSTDFTRVFDLIIITKNPLAAQIDVGRLSTKRYLLSPIPSFLRYTVGSSSQLIFNGSSHIVGDIFAKELFITPNAQYTNLNKNVESTYYSLSPSIHGDLYSTTSQPLTQLFASNFYEGHIPNLYHDSQFANINFDETFSERINESLSNIKNLNFVSSNWKQNLQSNIRNLIKPNEDYVAPKEILACTEIDKDTGEPIVIADCFQFITNFESDAETPDAILPIIYNDPVYVKGNLTIQASQPIHFTNEIYVDGDLTIVGMYPQIFYKSIIASNNINIVTNASTTINKNIIAGNELSITNLNSNIVIGESILSGEAMSISASSNETSNSSIKISSDIIAGSQTRITSENMNIELLGNLFISGNLIISGNDELILNNVSSIENDTVTFSSVVYVTGETTISNTNILTANNNSDHLVLMSKGKLLLTRINEFQYYDELSELKKTNYLPLESELFKPLKGFFYTEGEAELYGVGSLFYVHGGIFAKDKLTINAVRGKTSYKNYKIEDEEGQDKLSRFIVKYDDTVLYSRLNALPIVNNLQLYTGETTIK